jgi:hypothetical protein
MVARKEVKKINNNRPSAPVFAAKMQKIIKINLLAKAVSDKKKAASGAALILSNKQKLFYNNLFAAYPGNCKLSFSIRRCR